MSIESYNYDMIKLCKLYGLIIDIFFSSNNKVIEKSRDM